MEEGQSERSPSMEARSSDDYKDNEMKMNFSTHIYVTSHVFYETEKVYSQITYITLRRSSRSTEDS